MDIRYETYAECNLGQVLKKPFIAERLILISSRPGLEPGTDGLTDTNIRKSFLINKRLATLAAIHSQRHTRASNLIVNFLRLKYVTAGFTRVEATGLRKFFGIRHATSELHR